MPSLSRRFKIEVKLNEKPAYRLAQSARVNPNYLYKMMSGIGKVKNGDHRIIKIGKVLGIPAEECFEEGGEDSYAIQ